MTGAERQRRYRAKVRREELASGVKAKDERQVHAPGTLASINLSELNDNDIAALIYILQGEQERRHTGATSLAATMQFDVNPGAGAIVGPYDPRKRWFT